MIDLFIKELRDLPCFSMLDVELDLVSELLVISVAILEIKINKKAQAIVERKKVVLGISISS